ncbi:hypothetical protein BOTBODRAFT_28901 [Botryobasidium botryosum FD-172 SS1]|uniref:DUF6699 domain-containing protein n=1 Tax=Botryobasidium botryosum (strain FD-172 SS1) TaxID=930990 RepID=A0A067MSD8_BOTB1|nr:hypothetical protein BOTBODRAFT_28901 [Botryobasidium botryosum FD-172 SS1]
MPSKTHPTWYPYGYSPMEEAPPLHPYPYHHHPYPYAHPCPYPYPYPPFEYEPPPGKPVTGVCPLLDMPPSDEKPEIAYDVRSPVSAARRRGHHHHYFRHHQDEELTAAEKNAPAVYPTTSHLLIISRAFPWGIKVAGSSSGVTCDDVLDAVHAALQKPITPSEWWIATPEQRKKVVAAFESNCSAEKSGRERKNGILRVDWLCDHTLILGLEKDKEFIGERVREEKVAKDTWVLALTKG